MANKAPYYNHPKVLNTRGTEHMHTIHDVARAMNVMKGEHMSLLSLGKEVRVHRPAPGAPLKERRVKRDGVWVWEAVV